MVSEKGLNEIAGMKTSELIAAHNVVNRQVNAPILVGDRDERRAVLDAIKAEMSRRGF